MTSYFDKRTSQVSKWSDACKQDEVFLNYLAGLEEAVIDTVSLVTGDREFPADLREKIQGIIAVKSLKWNPERARKYAKTVRSSELLADLHSVFHEVAGRRVETRFGLLTDNPGDILKRRDAHDGG